VDRSLALTFRGDRSAASTNVVTAADLLSDLGFAHRLAHWPKRVIPCTLSR